MKLNTAALAELEPEARKKAEELLGIIQQQTERFPLAGFHACTEDCGIPGCVVHPKQNAFGKTRTPIQAVFCGNRFGKTTILTVKCLIQHIPSELLPERLRAFKLVDQEQVMGRYMCPSDDALHAFVLPEFRKWAPKDLLIGSKWDKAWDKQHNVLRFKDGGMIDFHTYKQDVGVLVGAARHYVGYDEPPPETHRNECLARLIDHDGFEMFALTPINMVGGGIGWINQKVWKRRESPNVTVIKGSIYDNPTLSKSAIDRVLAEYPEEERQAREHGDFIHFGGMVYPGGFEHVLVPPITKDQLEGHDVVVGIDPGLKNAAFTWTAFDSDQRAVVFDEVLLQEKTPQDYAAAIKRTNQKWGVKPLYVIDPSARNRSLTSAESVEGELARLGIFAAHGQSHVEAGVQQIRGRMNHGMFHVTENCRLLRDEAEEYRMEDRPDGEFAVVREKNHLLDATRYTAMSRPWHHWQQQRSREPLGWQPGFAPPLRDLEAMAPEQSPPLGAMS